MDKRQTFGLSSIFTDGTLGKHLPFLMVVRLHFTYILGKHCVPRLTVLQLIQAIYLLNKNTAQKNFVRKKSTYLAHFPFSYSYFCLLIDNSSSSSLKKKEKKFPHQIIIE